MTENPSAPTGDSGEERPDRALTLSPNRLAGSDRCLNCGTALKGPFCYYCGQPDRNFMRFFPALLREFFEEFMDLDSRFIRTMKPLLFKPGRLTRDYLEGRRFRYTPPLKLYLFASIGFFLLAALVSSNALNLEFGFDEGSGEQVVTVFGRKSANDLTPEQEANVRSALEQAGMDPEDVLAGFDTDPGRPAEADGQADGGFSADQIMVNGKPWHQEDNPVRLTLMPGFVNDWINEEVAQSPAKARRLSQNPNLIVDQIFDILPATMFVLLPAVALLFKFWYLFAKRYYIEHLIYALHNHAFIFVSLMLILLLNVLDTTALADRHAWIDRLTDWLVVVIGAWIPLYLLLSLRHVYRQGWLLTLGKFAVIGISYLSLLGVVTGFVALLSFLLI